ncbi:MAG TPA: PmoA family protein [Phycisphaerae bacterium]
MREFGWRFSVIGLAAWAVMSGQTAPPATGPGKIMITEEKTDLKIEIDGKLFTLYRFAETADDPEWQRPYFWPVQAADGTDVTSDQMRVFKQDPKTDHPHQRSIWVGWGDVNGANHWTQSPEKERHVKFSKLDADGFVEELMWDSKGSTVPVLSETRTVKVVAFADGSRGLDITSKFTAPTVDAVFKCKPLNVTGVESGICSVRVAKAITDGPDAKKWITSGGGENPATGEAEARVKLETWCDYSGEIHGAKYGAAVVDYPKNPGGMTPWHVRLFGLLAHIGPLNWTLKKDDSATYRHLVIIHPGDAKDAKIDEKAKTWREAK